MLNFKIPSLLFVFLGLLPSAYAGSANHCIYFYNKHSAVKSPSQALTLGETALEMQNILQLNSDQITKANDRLSEKEIQLLKTEQAKDETFLVDLAHSNIPLKDSADAIKKLVKFKVLFAKEHDRAFDQAYDIFFETTWRNSEKNRKAKLQALNRMTESKNPDDVKGVMQFVETMTAHIHAQFYHKEWHNLNAMAKIEVASGYAGKIGLSTKSADLVAHFNDLQVFLSNPENNKILFSVIHRALPEQINSKIKGTKNWKSYARHYGLTLSAATAAILGIKYSVDIEALKYGFATLGMLSLGGLTTPFGTIGDVEKHFAFRKFKKNTVRDNSFILPDPEPNKDVSPRESIIKESELREEHDDFMFSKIMKELGDGLSPQDFYLLSRWGSGLHLGQSNLLARQSRLDERLKLIADEMDPVLKALATPTRDAQTLAVFQRLVEVSNTQIQNLMIDYASLRDDYMSLSITADHYLTALKQLESSPELRSEQVALVAEKLRSMDSKRTMLLSTAQETNRAHAFILSVIKNLGEYNLIILTDVITNIKDRDGQL